MWVSSIVAEGANKGMTERDVVMVAHGGISLDHVVLVKTIILYGLSLPLWRLSDTITWIQLDLRLLSAVHREAENLTAEPARAELPEPDESHVSVV